MFGMGADAGDRLHPLLSAASVLSLFFFSLNYSYMLSGSALARSTRKPPIFSGTARINFSPLARVEAEGFPVPVSLVTFDHCLGVQAHPSRTPATPKFFALPGSASD